MKKKAIEKIPYLGLKETGGLKKFLTWDYGKSVQKKRSNTSVSRRLKL